MPRPRVGPDRTLDLARQSPAYRAAFAAARAAFVRAVNDAPDVPRGANLPSAQRRRNAASWANRRVPDPTTGTYARVLGAVAGVPRGLTARECGEHLALSTSTVRYWLLLALDAGLVRARPSRTAKGATRYALPKASA